MADQPKGKKKGSVPVEDWIPEKPGDYVDYLNHAGVDARDLSSLPPETRAKVEAELAKRKAARGEGKSDQS